MIAAMPTISQKTFKMLLKEEGDLAKIFTPEWRLPDNIVDQDVQTETDPGIALLKIFAHMQEEIIGRLNHVPDKNFGAFLDMLGLRLMPALPAKVPVTFFPAQGLSENAFISAGTQVAAAENDAHRALTYETVSSLSATGALIKEIYSVDPQKDKIYRHTDDFNAGKEFRFFDGDNIQAHVLYLGHGELFKISGHMKVTINISFEDKVSSDYVNKWNWMICGIEGGNIELDARVDPDSMESLDFKITLNPKDNKEWIIKETSINGINSLWIACSIDPLPPKSELYAITGIKISNITSDTQDKIRVLPDSCYHNFTPLDLAQKVYPFGRQPRMFDTFYLSCSKAFSKLGSTITINFKRKYIEKTNDQPSNEPTPNDVLLSWEYWSGKNWKALMLIQNPNPLNNFEKQPPNSVGDYTGNLVFNRPDDFAETEINGDRNYWIRVRLVNGDYGKDKFTPVGRIWKIEPQFHPPYLDKDGIIIQYEYPTDSKPIDIQNCIAYNNLEYRNLTGVTNGSKSRESYGFVPFIPMPERKPAVYIGFNKAFGKGNTSIFFSLREDEKQPDLDSRPKVRWAYWDQIKGQVIKPVDVILSLTSVEGIKKDTELLFRESLDGCEMAEIALVNEYSQNEITLDRKLDYDKNVVVLKRSYLESTDNSEYLTKSGTLEFLAPCSHPRLSNFGSDCCWIMGLFSNPNNNTAFESSIEDYKLNLMAGIYPNTVWAVQVETVIDEVLGSSIGEKNQVFRLIKGSATSADLWVREGLLISEEGREELSLDGIRIQEIKDRTGKVVDNWVQWKQVEELFDCGPRDRDYILDGASGEIIFGDGIHGMIPPIGRENIKVSYRFGGGVNGNVAAGEINTLKTPVAGIDRVSNSLPAEGGSDAEDMKSIFERGPHLIRHMDRAVTKEDFERISREASSYIARTKCIVDGSSRNKVKIIVIPKGTGDRPIPSSELLKIVKTHLLERSMNSISSEDIDVVEPSYREVSISVDVFPDCIDQAVPLEKEVRLVLKEFFHPITGGPDQTGWDFGRYAYESDIYSKLERIKGVDHIENLQITPQPDSGIADTETICSGEHTIAMKMRVKR
jgi:hypothetical protein